MGYSLGVEGIMMGTWVKQNEFGTFGMVAPALWEELQTRYPPHTDACSLR